MIQLGSMVRVIDNSGVKWVKVISFCKKRNTRYLYWGEMFKAVMRRFRRWRRKLKKPLIKRRQCWALVIATKKKRLNFNCNCYFFSKKHQVILFDFHGKPLGSRIFTKVPVLLRYLGFARFISLSAGVIHI